MPSEVTATAAIVTFVLMSVIISGLAFTINALIIIHNKVISSINSYATMEKQTLIIINASRLDATSVKLNFTVKGNTIIPFTMTQVITKYVNLANESVTYLLEYGSIPGWDLITFHVGNITRSLAEGNYLVPGEVAEIIVYLPTNASPNHSILVTVVSPTGSSASYSVGG